uniref:Toxin complex subunit TcaB n=1 Tax=Yersinia pseudotuberculosis TaxID=633 RepID=B2BCZ1_YERPU|nr:toxin complex subunit TcaB [Yersinia pseudotuberculosis]
MPTSTVLNKINESRRDALVNYYLAKNVSGDEEIKTAEQLYQYLLLDTKISHKVKTSPIAEAISSLQIYINRCVDGEETDLHEKNISKHFSTDNFLHNWNIYNKRYARWAGKEKLMYYAADYIDPTLRYNKTELFNTFEQSINNSKLTEKSVKSALQSYLISYEKLSQIDTIKELYIENIKTYFFLGKTRESPCQYYWRSSEKLSNDSNNLHWSEWRKVNCNINGTEEKFFINLSWHRSGLYIDWINTFSIKANKDETTEKYHYNRVYKNDDNTWSELIINMDIGFKLRSSSEVVTLPPFFVNQGDPNSKEEVENLFLTNGTSIKKIESRIHGYINGDIKILCNEDNISFEIAEKLINGNNGTISDIKLIENGKEILIIKNEKGEKKEIKLIDKFEIKIFPYNELVASSIVFNRIKPEEKIINELENKVSLLSPNSLPLKENFQKSVDELLSYSTQKDKVGLDAFNGSYGIYIWELFFHIPLLASMRFLNEQRFDLAQHWLKYLFNSAGYRDGNGNLLKEGDNILYWNSLPLQQDTDWDKNTLTLPTDDPDVIAMQDPMQYKLAIFMRTLDLIISQGDQAYRQLERDTLAEAKIYYIQASQLLGPRPDLNHGHQWENIKLAEESHQSENGHFLPPYNEILLSYWDKLEIRLYNLRHNLNLDGQPLHLPLFATPVDPKALQRQHGVGNGINSGEQMATAQTSLYRFPLLIERAKSAVSSVIQFGNSLQNVLERQDNEAMTLLFQQQQQQVLQHTKNIQNNNILVLQASLNATSSLKSAAEQRSKHYKELLDNGISSREQSGLDLRIDAGAVNIASVAPLMLAAALDTAPNVFGLADGGSHWGAVPYATSATLQISAGLTESRANINDIKANYDRRVQEWTLQKNQADKDAEQLAHQYTSVQEQLNMAQKQLNLAELEQGHADALYQMQSTRFTGKELYNWMAGRLSGLYFQLFDATQPLCLMAKAALEKEVDKAKTDGLFIRSGWNDLYQGLLAGEDLQLNLQKLENVWLMEEQRGLEVERTVSLAQHYQQLGDHKFDLAEIVTGYMAQDKTEKAGNEQDGVELKDGTLIVSLSINGLNLIEDYPAPMHLGDIRRIKQISVSLPALLGPYQDIQATLDYAGENTHLAKGCSALAISRGMNDSGQFQLDFNDGKYLPFEGIDISDKGTLVLRFPNATGKQKLLLQSLSDIILHIRYTIRS